MCAEPAEAAGLPEELLVQWEEIGRAIPEWRLIRQCASAVTSHGDSPRWLAALGALPRLEPRRVEFGDLIRIGEAIDGDDAERRALRAGLETLRPWRKGPFELFGVRIDSEWRSDWKWRRLAPFVGSLEGHTVLDVGCGNGYYGWRMRAAGARLVIGVDPTILFSMQHLAVLRYMPEQKRPANCLLPLRLEALPPLDHAFDIVFSMGVLYHRRDPLAHLSDLSRLLRQGGRLVLETLILDHDGCEVTRPEGRYARMRNVHAIPGRAALLEWLARSGFGDACIVDECFTTTAEQRRTAWMPYDSLAEALRPGEPARTVEGHQAPLRAIVIARR